MSVGDSIEYSGPAEFWKRMAFILMAGAVATFGMLWNGQDARIDKIEEVLPELREMIQANTRVLVRLEERLESERLRR